MSRAPSIYAGLLIATILLFLPETVVSLSQRVLTGSGIIVDGDTLVVNEQTIRLHGIDAPEVGQTCERVDGRRWDCGKTAMESLAELAEGRTVTCSGDELDDYDRLIAVCRSGDQDINALMVQEGHAWAFRRYSSDYAEQEAQAHKARRGIWQGKATPAWDYRVQKWQVAAQQAPDGCPIKGNISRNGRIYHPPWSPWYSRTKVSVEKGERWFCSEREALDAGWRAPRWR